MAFRSAWAVMMLAGAAITAGSCGAYPDREYKTAGPVGGAGGTAGGASGSGGTGGASGSSGASGSANGTGGGDASVAVVDAAKDTSSPVDVKADVDRHICRAPGAHPGLDCRCADGTVDDEFNKNLVGCADTPDLAAPRPGPCADNRAVRAAWWPPRSSGFHLRATAT